MQRYPAPSGPQKSSKALKPPGTTANMFQAGFCCAEPPLFKSECVIRLLPQSWGNNEGW